MQHPISLPGGCDTPFALILRSFVIALFVRTALTRSPLSFFALKLAAAGLATGPELLECLLAGLAAELFEASDDGLFVLAEDAATSPPGWYQRLARRARGGDRKAVRRILHRDHAAVRLSWLASLADRLRRTRRGLAGITTTRRTGATLSAGSVLS